MTAKNYIKQFLLVLMINLGAASSFAKTHYVCTDSTFYISSIQKLAFDSLPNTINQDDTIYLGSSWDQILTIIPDSLNTNFYWWIGELNTCNYEEIIGEDTIFSDKEGIYYYGNPWSGYNFSFYVIVVDGSKRVIEAERSIENEEEIILSLPPYFTKYTWSTGDTTNYTVVNESGIYKCIIRDSCRTGSSALSNIDLGITIEAGICDTASMNCFNIIDSGFDPGAQSWLLDYFIDIDEDGIDDINYYYSREMSGSYSWDIIKIQSFGNYYICIDGITGIVNSIKDGDLIGIKQYWKSNELIIISQFLHGVGRPINCDIGWNPYEEGENIGIKNVDGHQTVFGWLKVNMPVTGGHELSVAMQRKKELHTRHYVCTDSVFYMNSDPGIILDSLPNVIYPEDSVFLMQGASITLIPDTIVPDNTWGRRNFSFCSEGSTGSRQDTLVTGLEGRYCYGTYYSTGTFVFNVFTIDSSSLILEVNRKLGSEHEYILQVPDTYSKYLWSTGDTSDQTIIDQSGLYGVSVWDLCGNSYLGEIDIDLNSPVYAGVYDPSTMVRDTIKHSDIDVEWDHADEELTYDLDGDSIVDIYYKFKWFYHTSHHGTRFEIESFNDYYINISERNCLVNPIRQDNDVSVMQAWAKDERLLIGSSSWGTISHCGSSKTGWHPYWPEGKDFYIGIKKIDGENDQYGWIKVGLLGNDQSNYHFLVYSIQSDNAGISYDTSKSIMVFPNPFKDSFTLESNYENYTLELFDVNGKLVYQQEVKSKNETIFPTNLGAGFYIGRLHNQNVNIKFKLVKGN